MNSRRRERCSTDCSVSVDSAVCKQSKVMIMNVYTEAQIIVHKRYNCAGRGRENIAKLGVKVVVVPGISHSDIERLHGGHVWGGGCWLYLLIP